MRGVFVTATDTDVGKTVVAACIAATLVGCGLRVAAHKPVVTGVRAAPTTGEDTAMADHELLALMTGQAPNEVASVLFEPAVSPHLAAEMTDVPLAPGELVTTARAAEVGADLVVVEGVGGLLVPLSGSFLIRDFARELGLPLVVAARPGLGTINHTLLTLEAARDAGLDVRAVVITPWPEQPSAMERSNAETIGALGDIEVAFLPRLSAHTAEAYAAAGARLPVERWAE